MEAKVLINGYRRFKKGEVGDVLCVYDDDQKYKYMIVFDGYEYGIDGTMELRVYHFQGHEVEIINEEDLK